MLSKQIPLGIYEKALPAGDELNQSILLNNKYIFKRLPINSPQYSPPRCSCYTWRYIELC